MRLSRLIPKALWGLLLSPALYAYRNWDEIKSGMKEAINAISDVIHSTGYKTYRAGKAVVNRYSPAAKQAEENQKEHPEVIYLTGKNVSRIMSDNDKPTSILTSEFVEDNANNIRPAKNWINTNDTLIGDYGIPLSKISLFYGAEDGKLKAGPLSIFNPNTVVVPIRNRNIGKIKNFGLSDKLLLAATKLNAMKDSIYNEVAKQFITEHADILPPALLTQELKMGYLSRVLPLKVDLLDYDTNDKYMDLLVDNPLLGELDNMLWSAPGKWGKEFQGVEKMLFADEKGHSAFVNNPARLSIDDIKELNDSLSKHPMYPILVDNGRYWRYFSKVDDNHNYKSYIEQDLDRPNNSLYIIGTK